MSKDCQSESFDYFFEYREKQKSRLISMSIIYLASKRISLKSVFFLRFSKYSKVNNTISIYTKNFNKSHSQILNIFFKSKKKN